MAARLSSTEEELATTVSRSRTTAAAESSITTSSRVTSSSVSTSETSTLVRVTRSTTTSSLSTEIETTSLPTTRSTSSARVTPPTTDTPVVAAVSPTIRSTPSNAQGLASATSTAFADAASPEKTNVVGPVVGAVGGLVVLLLLAWLGRMCYKRKHSKKDLARLDKMYKGEDKFEGGIYENKSEKPPQNSYGSLGSPNPISDFVPPSPVFAAPYATMSGSTTSLSRPSSIRSFDSSAPFFPSTDRDITAQLPNTKAHTMSRPSSPILPSEHFISAASPLSNPFTTPTLSQDGFRSSTPPLGSPVPLLESNPPTIKIDDNTGSYIIADDDDSIHETKEKHGKKESVTDFGFMGALMEEK